MSMDHEFYLLSKDEYKTEDIFELRKKGFPRSVYIHDDLIQYILDTLFWIPCFNPSRNERLYGLCLYGVTIIDQQGAAILRTVFSSWAQLFSVSPEQLKLQGAFMMVVGSNEEGEYEKIVINRDEIVSEFQKLAGYAEKVMKSDDLIILHMGI